MALLFDSPEMREQDRITAEAYADPKPGDEFHEMYSFWVIVLAVEPDGGQIITVTAVGPGALADIGQVVTYDTAGDFRAAYAYGSIPGYSVMCSGRERYNVTGWLDRFPRHKWIDGSARRRDQAAEALRNPKKCGECGQVVR